MLAIIALFASSAAQATPIAIKCDGSGKFKNGAAAEVVVKMSRIYVLDDAKRTLQIAVEDSAPVNICDLYAPCALAYRDDRIMLVEGSNGRAVLLSIDRTNGVVMHHTTEPNGTDGGSQLRFEGMCARSPIPRALRRKF